MADDRLIEIMSDVLNELRDFKNQTGEELRKVNLGLNEVRLSVMKLSQQIADFAEHEQRIKKLESTVFRQAS